MILIQPFSHFILESMLLKRARGNRGRLSRNPGEVQSVGNTTQHAAQQFTFSGGGVISIVAEA